MPEHPRVALRSAADGGSSATLLPLVYESLRNLARSRLARDAPGQTLQPTALVHEAYLRLVRGGRVGWDHRGHFFSAAAEAMRRILIERARRARRAKRGGALERVPYDEATVPGTEWHDEFLTLDRALRCLEREHPRPAEVVRLRWFVGLSIEETAAALGMGTATVKRDWNFARAWLACELRPAPPAAGADAPPALPAEGSP